MKVLELNMTYPYGSTGRIVHDIALRLHEEGDSCYIAYAFGESQSKYDFVIDSDLKSKLRIVCSRIWGRNGFTNKKATKKLVEWIKEVNPDVVHLHNLHGMYIDVRVLFDYLKTSNVQVVWTLHDCWSFTGHCAHFDYVNCTKWKQGCGNCEQLAFYPKAYVDKTKDNYKDKKNIFLQISKDKLQLVAPSKWLAELVGSSFFQGYNITCLYNGIDTHVFKPSDSNLRNKYGLQNKKIVLAVMFGYNVRKGILDLNKVADMLDDDYQIILIGIENKDGGKVNSKIITVPKTTNQKELAEFYSVADVYVNLTLEEVLGLTNIEALACGTPVITYNSGGSPECIDDETGIIVEKGNVKEVVEKIAYITSKDKGVYSAKCRLRAEKIFDKNLMIDRYVDVYKQMIEKDRGEKREQIKKLLSGCTCKGAGVDTN